MPKIRVLIVDDAVVIRKILTDQLSLDPDIEIVGTAANGRIALQKMQQVQPDIVTLDVEMPEMDGLETLTHLRKEYPKVPVIMLSTLTERGAAATMEALAKGAADYVTKPANVGKVQNAKDAVRDDLLRKIKSLCRRNPEPKAPASPPAQVKPVAPRPRPVNTPELVVIGVSTGGPNALATLVPQLPAHFPVPIAIVQHMPPMFTRLLAERLCAQSKIKVVEAVPFQKMAAGTAYIAPGDFHLELGSAGVDLIAKLNQNPPENSCRPAVDVLFRSAAALMGGSVLGVVLTGMGHDGMVGCRHIREAGGQVIAQDQATSVVWGMPGAVVEHGLADAILPLTAIADEIVRRCMKGRGSGMRVEGRAGC